MNFQKGASFWKHREWCGRCADHKFIECPYNDDVQRGYFHAPCCGRSVRFLKGKLLCKKCVKLGFRSHHNERTDRDKYYPQIFDTTLKFDEAQLDRILGKTSLCLKSVVEEIRSSVSTILDDVGQSATDTIVKITLALALIWRVREDKLSVALAIAQFLYSMGLGRELVKRFEDFMSGVVDGFQCQVATCEDVFNIVAVFLSIVTLRQVPEGKKIAQFFRDMCSVRNFSTTATSIVTTVKDMILLGIKFVQQIFLGYSPEWVEDKPHDIIITWCDEVDLLHKSQTKGPWTQNMLDDLDNLSDRMMGIQAFWRINKPPVTVVSIFQTHANIVRKMLDDVAIVGVRQVPRIEPTFIMLQGPTAYGKSLITPLLSIDLIKSCIAKDSAKVWSSYVYNRNAETKFWDGYAGQKVIVYDDFGQSIDTLTNPNSELLEIIRLGNSAPYFPDMARLEAKGRTRICCEFVLMTANHAPQVTSIYSLKEPEAVLRRVDNLISVDVKQEFKNNDGSVNYDLVLQTHVRGECHCGIPADVDMCLGQYVFTLKRWREHAWMVTRDALSYGDLITDLTTRHKDKVSRCAKRLAYINERLSGKHDPQSGGNISQCPVYTVEEAVFDAARWAAQHSSVDYAGFLQGIRGFFDILEMDLDFSDFVQSVMQRYMQDFHSGLVAEYEPQMGDDSDCFEILVRDVRDKNKDAVDILASWSESIPSTSNGDWTQMVWNVANGEWDANFLRMIAEQESISAPEYHCTSSNKQRFANIKKMIQIKMAAFMDNPIAKVLIGIGSIAGVALLARLLVPLFADKQKSLLDVIRVWQDDKGVHKEINDTDGVVDFTEDKSELVIRLKKGDFCVETNATTGDKSHMRKDKRQVRYQKWDKGSYVAQSFEDPALQDAEKVVFKNMVAVYITSRGVQRFAGHGLMVYGRTMLTFGHLFHQPVDLFEFKRVITGHTFSCTREQMVIKRVTSDGKDLDAAFVRLPLQYPMCRDIRRHFAPLHSTSHTFFRSCLLSVRGLANEGSVFRVLKGKSQAQDHYEDYDILNDGRKERIFVREHYTHDMDTVKGDCGAVLLQCNSSQQHKILGIHVAGGLNDNPNLACSISREIVDTYIDEMEDGLVPEFEVQGVEVYEGEINHNLLNFDVIGKVNHGVSDATSSLIRESPLFGKLGDVTTHPAVLFGSVDGHDVKCEAIQKNAPMEQVFLSTTVLSECEQEAKRRFNNYQYSAKRQLTLEEAVFGRENDAHIPSLNVNSSPGYPWVLSRKRKGKRDFIDLDKKWISLKVRAAVEERLLLAESGKRSATVFVDHLKDERRPILNNKFLRPRLFSGGPIDFTIAFRMHFGAYCAYVMENRIKNSVAVGVNVHGTEWTLIADHLQTFGKNVLAGDFSNYDGTLNVEMVWSVFNVINAWYGNDGNQLVRRVLWSEIANSVHLWRDTLYMVSHSNPSGNPMTTILNSMYQYIAWVYVLRKQGYRMDFIVKNTAILTYGDDNLVVPRDKFLDPTALISGFKELGMSLTGDVKGEQLKYKSLTEVTFLKRRFRFDNELGRYMAPLSMETICEMVYWYNKPGEWDEVGKDVIEASVRESVHHGRSIFKEHVANLTKVCGAVSFDMPACASYDDYCHHMLEGEYLYMD